MTRTRYRIDYLHAIRPEERERVIEDALKTLRKYTVLDSYSAIAAQGVSGLLIGPIIARELKKDLIIVRKQESSHSDFKVEGAVWSPYIIVDDFEDTGKTQHDMRKKIKAATSPAVEARVDLYQGTYLYGTRVWKADIEETGGGIWRAPRAEGRAKKVVKALRDLGEFFHD